MTITKIGHCCLLIEIDGKRIMTDPGSFTVEGNVQERIDVVVVTHEHADHVHVPSVKVLLDTNPDLVVVGNSSVATLLAGEGVTCQVLEGTASVEIAGVYFEAFDATHAEIFEEVGQVHNTGYFISKRLFYPGDAYGEPGKPVDVLALPVGGPWCRMTDTLHYALRVNPKAAFPVHDAIEREDRVHIAHGLAGRVLGANNIQFTPLKAGESTQF